MLKRYPIRVVKYFLFLVALFVVLFGIMIIFNWSSWSMLMNIWKTDQVWVLVAVFIGIPLIYPFFGYTAREVRGNLDEKRDVVERVLTMSGFTVTENRPTRIIAHTKGIKKVSLMFEDRIEITPEGNHFLRIEGHRREVVKIEARIRTFMNL